MGNLQYNGTLITPMRAILEKKNNEILKEEERSYHILQASQIWKLLNLPGPVIQEFCVKKGVGLHKVSNIKCRMVSPLLISEYHVLARGGICYTMHGGAQNAMGNIFDKHLRQYLTQV